MNLLVVFFLFANIAFLQNSVECGGAVRAIVSAIRGAVNAAKPQNVIGVVDQAQGIANQVTPKK